MKTRGSTQHIPDILDCLAQLSNDEVPTPPKVARAMLDILPDDVWSNPDYRWLDPFCKSGVFLREIAARLLVGLEAWGPDFEQRRDHIFRNMLYGASITEMTGIISRRSLYCSRDASGEHSVVRFATESGNLPFIPTEHTFGADGKCSIFRAPAELERGEKSENYAYSFIHGTYPTKEMSEMKFDVIVGNPPYQIDDGGHNASATPIYQHFVSAAIDLKPKYVLMITPSRWFAGGKGLSPFRSKMNKDHRLWVLVDYPKLYDGFPGVKIRGGVSYFLWCRDEPGPCRVQTMWDGQPTGAPVERFLDAYDVLVRRNEAVSILEKVRERGEQALTGRVSSRKPFGLPTNFHGAAALARRWNSPLLVEVNEHTLAKVLDHPGLLAALEQVEDFRALVDNAQQVVTSTKLLKKAKREQGGKLTPEQSAEQKETNKQRKEIREKLQKFLAKIPVFMYATDFREEALKDVIESLDSDLFERVTGLTVDDFRLLNRLGLFNAQNMNHAIYQFRSFERASLLYASEDRLRDDAFAQHRVGLWDRTVDEGELPGLGAVAVG